MLRKRTFVAIFCVLLICCGAGEVKADPKPEQVLTFQNIRVGPEIRLMVKNNVKYVNLAFLTKYMRMTTDWKPANGSLIRLRMGNKAYQLAENVCSYAVDNEVHPLNSPALIENGQAWIPLEFLAACGVVVGRDEGAFLDLEWDSPYLMAAETVVYKGRPAIRLIGTQPIVANSYLLAQPDRIVLDITGMKAHPSLDQDAIRHPFIKQLRINQSQPDMLRLVFDIPKRCGFRIVTDPKNPNQLLLVLNVFLQKVDFETRNGALKVRLETDYPAKYTVTRLANPARLVIDFEGTTLDVPAQNITGDGRWIKQIRMSQYNLITARLVFDLSTSESICYVKQAQSDPRVVEIRTLQTVNAIQWYESTADDDGGQLVIDADGEMEATVCKLTTPSQLQINLQGMKFGPAVRKPWVRADSQIGGIGLSQAAPDVVQVEIDLKYYVGYELECAPDNRRIILKLKKSTLIGKTVVVDPGHGGDDGGAMGKQGVLEKRINLQVALHLAEMLDDAGANVVMTRNSDYFIGLFERANLANSIYADLFVSIHSNSHPTRMETRGLEVYYYEGRAGSGELAKKVESAMAGIYPKFQMFSLGVKKDDFAVIRETTMPSILVELGYLSNPMEESTLASPDFQEGAAMGLIEGISDYYR